jgi:hypothetical protein
LSFKPTLVALVIVLAAGGAIGVLIGGKTETKTVTVTAAGLVRTVTVAAPADRSAVASPPAPPTTNDPEPTPGFERVVLDDKLVTIDDTTESTAGEDDNVTLVNQEFGEAQLQQGPLKNDSLTFDFDSACCDDDYAADYYQLEITVPDGATRFQSEMGFQKGEASGNIVKVAFYRNEYSEDVPLRQRQLSSASEVAPVDLVVKGASKIIVRFVCVNPGRRWRQLSGDAPSFGFLDAHFE